MIIPGNLVNLKKPVLILPRACGLKTGEEYFFEFCDIDYKFPHPDWDTPRKIMRKLEKFGNGVGFNLGTKLKGFLNLEYKQKYRIKII